MVNDKSSKDFELVLLKELLINDIQKRFQSEIGVHLSAQDADVFAYACENGRISLLDVRKLTASTKAQARAIVEKLVVQALLQQLDDNLYELTQVMQQRYGHFVETDTNLVISTKQEPSKYHGSTDEVTEVVTDEVQKLIFVVDDEMKRKEIQDALGLKHEVHFRDAYLTPAMEAKVIEMTIPDKPTSSKQKYRLTSKGIVLAEKLKEDKI